MFLQVKIYIVYLTPLLVGTLLLVVVGFGFWTDIDLLVVGLVLVPPPFSLIVSVLEANLKCFDTINVRTKVKDLNKDS